MQEFKAGDKVEFIYGTGSTREMTPYIIKWALEMCAQYGCTQFEILKVEHIPEEKRGGVGHHQWVYLIETKTRKALMDEGGFPSRFSGASFAIVR